MNLAKLVTVTLPFLLLIPALDASGQTTYHVRPDGGDRTQCNGLANAPYPGSGTQQNCAWRHPFFALDASGNWMLRGGDTLLIHRGSYRMGYGEGDLPEDMCHQNYPWDCHLPPLPSGPDQSRPTRILGEGWDSGCPSPPELWGSGRASWILDLRGTSNAVIACLEITDHSSCFLGPTPSPDSPLPPVCLQDNCPRDNFPNGDFDYADEGIRASDSSNVTLQDLNIHGLAETGIRAGRISNWTVVRVRIAANGGAGWNGDLGEEDSSYSGTHMWHNLTVEWNGCPESYPGREPQNCWAQEICGGYGDGVGLNRSGGHFIIEDSVFRYNTSDGLDLLYVGVGHPDSSVEIYRTAAYGNAGNQLKVGGSSRLLNCFAWGNCAFFYGKPFAQRMGGMDSGNHCRAGGAALSISLPRGRASYIVNNTVASQGWACAELQPNNLDFHDQPPPDGTERVYLFNNIFKGYQVAYLDFERLSDFIGDGDPYHFTRADTDDYNLIHNCFVYDTVPLGPHIIRSDPLFANDDITDLDAHLQGGSPAIGQGMPIGSLGGLVPGDDIEGLTRSDPPDLGAYQYGGVTTCRLSCSATVPASAQVDTPVNFTGRATPSSACSGTVTYDWDFGDGSAHSDRENVTHTYNQTGTFSWRFSAEVDSVSCSRAGYIIIRPPIVPPTITSITQTKKPYRILINGANFQEGVQVFLGEDTNPWGQTMRESDSLIVLRGGRALKAHFPRRQPVRVLVRNPDGGEGVNFFPRP
jgi:hypothetical protein